MIDESKMQNVHDLLCPDQPDPRASTLIVGKSPEAIMYYSMLQKFDARIYLCAEQLTFERRLIDDPLIKLIVLFETDLGAGARQALSSLCGRSDPLHIITIKIVSILEHDHDADAFKFTYGAFKHEDSEDAERVLAASRQALDRASQIMNDQTGVSVSDN